MSRKLSKLLGRPENLVTEAIQKLEELSGWQSTDVKLLYEINHKLREKIGQLGLDPNDTTGQELYYSLVNRYKADDLKLAHALGLSDRNHQDSLDRVFKTANQYFSGQKTFALKNSVAKKILLDNPPKKLMKILNYRSIESILKRENTAELFFAAPLSESTRWLKNFKKSVKNLKAMDFEEKDLELISLDNRLNKVLATNFVGPDIMTGSIFINTTSSDAGSPSRSLVSIHRAVEEVVDGGRALQSLQWTKHFPKQVEAVLRNDYTYSSASIANEKVSWRLINKQFARSLTNEDILLNTDDKSLSDKPASRFLSSINRDFNWWSGTEHIGIAYENLPLSFHIADVARSAESKVAYAERYAKHMATSLWDELVDRYIHYPGVEKHLLSQLEFATESQTSDASIENQIQKEFNPAELARV